jgi:hypothetical protein
VISAIQKEGFLSEDDVFDECDIIKKRTPILEWHTWALQNRICARFFSGAPHRLSQGGVKMSKDGKDERGEKADS